MDIADVLQAAVRTAKERNISTIAIASTTGKTAAKFLELIKSERLKVIVVTHDEGKPLQERIFSEDTRRILLAHNIRVYTYNPPWFLLRKIISKLLAEFGLSPWRRNLREAKRKYGPGIKVCFIILQMLMEAKILREGKVVAIAGTKSGADSVGIFLIQQENKWPILEETVLNRL